MPKKKNEKYQKVEEAENFLKPGRQPCKRTREEMTGITASIIPQNYDRAYIKQTKNQICTPGLGVSEKHTKA